MADIKKTFTGKLYTQQEKPADIVYAEANGITAIPGAHNNGLGKDRIHYGSNSGYQAINLAFLMGAKLIYLLGYDMGRTGGKSHWFGSHPAGLCEGNYEQLVPRFTKLATDLAREGVEVVNLSRATNLQCFKRSTIEDVWAI